MAGSNAAGRHLPRAAFGALRRRAPAAMTVASRQPQHVAEVKDATSLGRALHTISTALLTDGVTTYLSKPGREHEFHHAVFASYLHSGPQLVLAAGDYGCCALMAEVRHQPGEQQHHSVEQLGMQLVDSSKEAAAAVEAAVVAHARGDRSEALERLQHQPLLQSLVQEHGTAICVHFIGADPQQQGQGLGSALLRHICQLADRRRRHLYLEASTARSQALYARHGFVHLADKPLGDDDSAPVLKVMVRPPSSATLEAAVASGGLPT